MAKSSVVRRTVKTARRVTTINHGKVRIEQDVRVVCTEKRSKPAPIMVVLPHVEGIPQHLRGSVYIVKNLLTDGADNPKLAKSNLAETVYRSWGLALSPAKESGYQTCSSSSPGCRNACLHHQGQARVYPDIAVARIAKTIAFFEQREAFLALLRWELERKVILGQRDGFIPAVRLNLVSDILWERIAPWIFYDFPGIRLYDYTKHVNRMLDFCAGKLPCNYHLTFSRSECNQADCLRVLVAGGNVAVVFSSKDLPAKWHGYTVVNGDETDLRFSDPRNVVVGLYAKGTAAQDDSGFVVPTRRIALQLV
jgi:hypothetical protein